MNEVTNGVADTQQAALPEVPEKPVPVAQLTRGEFLELENLSLKVQNLHLQERQLQHDLVEANKLRRETQGLLEARAKEVSQAHGIDLSDRARYQLQTDGSVYDLMKIPNVNSDPLANVKTIAKTGS